VITCTLKEDDQHVLAAMLHKRILDKMNFGISGNDAVELATYLMSRGVINTKNTAFRDVRKHEVPDYFEKTKVKQ